MGISLKTHKLLWAHSGGKCAICKNLLIVDPADLNDDPSIVGDEWQSKADLDNWLNTSSRLTSADDLALPKDWYQAEKGFLVWLLARIWPQRYGVLENAMLNYGIVLQDFLNIFDKHADWRERDD